MNRLKNHPNAAVAIVSIFGLGTIVVNVADHYGVNLDANQGLWIAGGIAGAALAVGRAGARAALYAAHNGASGTWRTLKKLALHGTRGK